MPRKKQPPVAAEAVAPTTLKFTHTRLLVDDIDACYKFYRDTLGLKPRFDGEGSVYAEFDCGGGGHVLALFSRQLMNNAVSEGAAMPVARITNGCGDVLITFEVADVDATYAHLMQKGVQFIGPPMDQKDWLLRVAHFRDPDGHVLEINCALTPAQ